MPSPLKTFIIYSSHDRELRAELENHLRPLVDEKLLELWSDREILPGEVWEEAIRQQLHGADLFLILVSIHFYNSGYIKENEVSVAKAKHDAGNALVIPIIVGHCTWKRFPIVRDLQVLPPGGNPVVDLSYWHSRDKAWEAVVENIAIRAESLQTGREKAHDPGRPGRAEETAGPVRSEPVESKAVRKKVVVAGGKPRTGKAVRSVQPGRKKPEPAPAETPPRVSAPEKTAVRPAPREVGASPKRAVLNESSQRDMPGGPEMVLIPGGRFSMGSNKSAKERPVHPVEVHGFRIGKFPVTFEEYDLFCDSTGHMRAEDSGWGRGRRPVANVLAIDARAYCEWLSARTGRHYRLPSEAEWEYAARGGPLAENFEFAGSDLLEEVGWYAGNSRQKTHPVGEKKPNALGLFDLSGNVWEICEDKWHHNYQGAPADGTPWTRLGTHPVIRGGSCFNQPGHCRVAVRNFALSASWRIGFRVVAE